MNLVDYLVWGQSDQIDLTHEDVSEDGKTFTASDLSGFTTREASVKVSTEDATELFSPTLTEPSTGVVRVTITPAQSRLLPRTGTGSAPPTVVCEVMLYASDGSDSFQSMFATFTVLVGAIQ